MVMGIHFYSLMRQLLFGTQTGDGITNGGQSNASQVLGLIIGTSQHALSGQVSGMDRVAEMLEKLQ